MNNAILIPTTLPSASISPATAGNAAAGKTQGSGFGTTLEAMLNRVNAQQIAGDRAIENLQAGDSAHLHDVMIAVEEADISLRMLVQIRNRALTAYEEIMRMQI